MKTGVNRRSLDLCRTELDAQIGNALIEVKFRTDALRTVRTSIMEVAYALAKHPNCNGFLVLVGTTITDDRLAAEWQSAKSVLQATVMDRLTICIGAEGTYRGIPRDPSPEMQHVLGEVVSNERLQAAPRQTKTDYSYIIFKLLLHEWLTKGEPVTADWLARSAGCTYPTVARALGKFGSLLAREPDRRISLLYFPRDEFSRLIANSSKVRSTTRFVDHSGRHRSPEAHLRRLEKLNPPELALGGVLGARHYDRDLDLVGTPRLDLSMHCTTRQSSLSFIENLDPALKLEEDPLKPANVSVHIIRDANPLFEPREGGLLWADPVECLLDLHEARLEVQATQFLNALLRNRPSVQ
jgi:hypothetical protein